MMQEERMKLVKEFSSKYPTKEEKIEALKKMSDEEIDALIADCPNIYGKIFYKQFKKGGQK